MKISIITVCKNAEATIERAIKSVIDQDYQDIEFIVIDGKSNDKTLSIINRYRNFIDLLITEKDNGVYHAMNKGIKYAKGEYVGFLNADDFFIDNQTISKIFFEINKGKYDIFYADINVVNKNQKILQYWKTGQYYKNSFTFGWHPPHPSLYIKRKIYSEIGNYNETYKFSADFDFMLRLFELNSYSSIYYPKPIVNYQLGGGSSKNIRNIIIGNLNIFDSLMKNKVKFNFFKFYFYRFLPKLKRLLRF